MVENLYDKFNVKEVINASGKMTILGVSRVADSVIEAQKFGGQNFFEISDLLEKTGLFIANLVGAEDAVIVSCASAGIAQTVAGIIGEGSKYHLYNPYTENITKRDIILPKGHNVDYGTPVELMVKLGGGNVVEAGYANMCTSEHIDMMITENTAAILYIKSHHTVQKSMLSIEEAAKIANKNNIPLIVDAAAEEDLKKYLQLGADIVIYSGGKGVEGPSSGFVVGKSKLIEWTRLQSKGIGRAMKIGKENILGLTAAIELYLQNGPESGEHMKDRLSPFIKDLNSIPFINASIEQDGAGREIYRAKVKVQEDSPVSAKEIIKELKQGNPAIYTREYLANNGIIEFDIRAVNEKDMKNIVKELERILNA